jgi:hypothetical protein
MQNQRTCSVEGCEREHEGRGWCHTHHYRWKRHGDPQVDKPIRGWRNQQSCSIEGCEGRYYSRGWCNPHYQRWRHRGDPTAPDKRAPNGQANYINESGYRVINANGRIVLEHRHVMEQVLGRPLLPNETPHHKNGQRADNRPENLELWVSHQPKGQRAVDLLAWAEEIVARYAPERDLL